MAAVTAASRASGGIIFIDNSHAFTLDATHQTVNWDIDGGGSTDFTFTDLATGTGFQNYVRQANALNFWVQGVGSGPYDLKAINLHATIGPVMASGLRVCTYGAQFFSSNGVIAGGLHSGEQLVGFQFAISGNVHYGWADITIATRSLTINSWAYNSLAGASIQAGTVPEPANAALGLGLLALGAAGVSAHKRRRKPAA